MSLSDVTIKNNTRGIHLGIHSIGGVGKTTLGATLANIEKGIVLQLAEDGLTPLKLETPHINIGCNVDIESLDEMSNAYIKYQDILKEIILSKHEYKWIIQDPFTYFIKSCFEAYIIKTYYKGNISASNSYGSKYHEYQIEFNKLIEAFKQILNKNINILTLCHGTIIDYKDPSIESYKKWEVDLPIGTKVNLANTFYNHVDGLFFGQYDIIVDANHKATSTRRILRTSYNPAYTAKNFRLQAGKTLPDPILFDCKILLDQLIKGGAIVSTCKDVPVEK